MGAIGISWADDADLLAAAGADILVTSLGDVDLGARAEGDSPLGALHGGQPAGSPDRRGNIART
jgi:hypothetical protein